MSIHNEVTHLVRPSEIISQSFPPSLEGLSSIPMISVYYYQYIIYKIPKRKENIDNFKRKKDFDTCNSRLCILVSIS